MKQGIEMTDVWQLVTDGQNYNSRLGYYKMVDENYDYVMGDQWKGVVTNGLPTVTINMLKRVRDYKVSSIMSQKVKGQYSVENINTNTQDPAEAEILQLVDIITNFVEIKWEKEKMDSKVRECLMDGFATGDYCILTYWDTEKQTGQYAKGDFCTEVIDGVNVLFGNPNNREVEKQPYIILLGRDMVKNLRKEAKNNGVKKEEYETITVDNDTQYTAGQYGKVELDKSTSDYGKCTYAIKLWKEDGKVYFTKSTKFCTIRSKVDMKIKRYPVAFGNWEKVKNSYRGRAECTGLLPNQRYVNKAFAMLMVWMMYNALGKTIYDSSRITGWSNDIGVAIPVNGEISNAVQQLQPGNFNSGVLEVINMAMKETLNSIGVNDVIMGDIRPENTSAIIAVQKQSAVPLENVQANLYQFIEDIYLIWAEFIIAMYTTDRMLPQKQGEDIEYANFNSTSLQDKLLNVKVDVGPSHMWSEITSMQTLDSLLQSQYVDFIQYLERIPDGIIPKKHELIDELKQRAEEQKMIQQMIQQEQQAQAQQNQSQEEEMQSQQMNDQYEKMAQYMDQLPEETQKALQQLPPEEMEKQVLTMMKQSVNQSMQAT